MKKFNFVYITINKVNGKCYVGSHGTENENDKYLGTGTLIKYAIKKYGKENFLQINLKRCDNIKEARDKEEHYINLFNTIAPAGYNIHPKGGLGFLEHTEETKEKFKEIRSGVSFDEFYGLEKSKEIRNKISKNNAHYWKNKKQSQETKDKRALANTGKKRTEETKNKIKNSLLGKKHSKERRKNESTSHIGQIPWNKGIKTNKHSSNYKIIPEDELHQIINMHVEQRFSPKKISALFNDKYSWIKIMKTLKNENVFKPKIIRK